MRQAMTAYQAYYDSIDKMILPASIIVEDGDGDVGLATLAAPFLGTDVEDLVLSDDRHDRAVAAIMAINLARERVETVYEDVHAL